MEGSEASRAVCTVQVPIGGGGKETTPATGRKHWQEQIESGITHLWVLPLYNRSTNRHTWSRWVSKGKALSEQLVCHLPTTVWVPRVTALLYINSLLELGA